MTTYIGGQVWPAAKTILDEAFAEFDDGWVPTAADFQPVDTVYALDGSVVVEGEPEHSCPDGVCADMAAAFNLDEQTADWRSLAAWARTVKTELHRARAVRGKRVKMLRRQYAGQP